MVVKMNGEKKQGIVTNFFWRFLERCGAQGVKFIVELVLARLLLPDDYGLIALVTVFIELLNVFVDSGMGNALIQKKNADDLDFSSVFYFNMCLCLFIYFILFLSAPFIASFYERIELCSVLRVLGLQIVISGVKNVQQAYVSRTMQFKKFFFATLGGTVGAAVLGIVLAYADFGVWALVAQQLFNATVDTLILWVTVKWRPKKMFSIKRLKNLFGFGWKLLVSNLLDTGYRQIRALLIGKFYTSSDLAYYNRGEQFPQLFVNNVNIAIDSVLLPAMSNEQDNKKRIKEMTRRAIKTSTYIMAPFMMGLAFTGSTLISLLLTEKWLFCVPFMRVFCITYMFYPIHTANLNAIKAMGRSDLFLKLEILKKIVGLIALFSTMWLSVKAMAYSLLVVSILSQIINSWPNRYLLNYGYFEQIKDILPGIVLAVFMGICILPFSYMSISNIAILMLQIFVGIIVYLGGSIMFKLDSFRYLWEILMPILKKKS